VEEVVQQGVGMAGGGARGGEAAGGGGGGGAWDDLGVSSGTSGSGSGGCDEGSSSACSSRSDCVTRLLRAHQQQLVQLEAELQCLGGWCLLEEVFMTPTSSDGVPQSPAAGAAALGGECWDKGQWAAQVYLRLRREHLLDCC
jgi:hypothetical protein